MYWTMIFQVPEGFLINMTIDQFSTEFFGTPCDTDWVEIYDNDTETGR